MQPYHWQYDMTQKRCGHRLQKAPRSESCSALVHQAFGQGPTISDRRTLTSTTAQHAFSGRFKHIPQTYSDTQSQDVSICFQQLGALCLPPPCGELLFATTLFAFSGTPYNCSIGPTMPSRCRCLSPSLNVIYTAATSCALRHCRQSGADCIVQES